jgi:hypothetical protein
MKFTSDSWQLKLIKLCHPEHLQVARQHIPPVGCAPERVEPNPHHECNANKDSVDDFITFSYLEYV